VGRSEIGVNIERIDSEKAEREIAERAGVDWENVIVDIPPYESSEYSIPVKYNGEYVSIEKISPLVSSLKNAQISSWKMGVYCPPEFVEKVRKAGIEYFNIRVSKQKTLNELFEL